jgi:hypothetical protein
MADGSIIETTTARDAAGRFAELSSALLCDIGPGLTVLTLLTDASAAGWDDGGWDDGGARGDGLRAALGWVTARLTADVSRLADLAADAASDLAPAPTAAQRRSGEEAVTQLILARTQSARASLVEAERYEERLKTEGVTAVIAAAGGELKRRGARTHAA